MKLNHVLVRSNDLNAMSHFWTEIIGLESGQRPPFLFHGAWFYSGGQPLVHVVSDKNTDALPGAIAHVAFEGTDYKALITRLNHNDWDYVENDVPLTGERQVFVRGPDGVTTEMLFPLGTTNNESHPYERVSS